MEFISNVWNKAASAIAPETAENGPHKQSEANSKGASPSLEDRKRLSHDASASEAVAASGGDGGGTALAAAVEAVGDSHQATSTGSASSAGASGAGENDAQAAGDEGVASHMLHNVENVSHKAMEGAKSFGSFLFSVANKAGKTVTETATKVKTAVEENSILADFNHEQASFLASMPKNSAGSLPWSGCENEEEMRKQILSLSEDKRTFVRNPPNGVQFEFDFENYYTPIAMAMLKEDPRLEKMRFDLVPKLISEHDFWRNYFYRVSLVKQSSQLNSLAKTKNDETNSTDTSSAEGPQTPSDDDKDDDGADSGIPSDFVSDSCEGKVNPEDVAKGMRQLGVSSGDNTRVDQDLEQEIEKELDGYEVVSGSASDGHAIEDDNDLEDEIQKLLSATRK